MYNIRNSSVCEASCLEKDSNGKPTNLKRNDAFFFQVQAQIFVTQRKYGDFLVMAGKDFFYERIYPDEKFWNTEFPKAKLFFEKVVLPELLGKAFTRPNAEIVVDVEDVLQDMEE